MKPAKVVFFLFLASTLPAQKALVHPAHYAGAEGAAASHWPFGSPLKWSTHVVGVRYQQIHDALSTNTVVIKGMTLRRDARNTLFRAGWSVQMELLLSTSRVSASRIQARFASNLGKDAVTVISRRMIHFPALPGSWAVPKPFECPLPFDPGKTFALKGGASLCWEARVYSSDLWKAREEEFDFDAVKPVDRVVAIPFGHGCYAPNRLEPAQMGFWVDPKNYTAWDLLPWVQDGPIMGWGILLASVRGNPDPISLGGPFCRLYLDPAGLFPISPVKSLTLAGQLADRLFYIPIPRSPALQGVSFRTQWLLGTARRGEVILTNAAYVYIPMPPATAPWNQIGTCIATAKHPALLKEGTPRPGFGLVVRFRI